MLYTFLVFYCGLWLANIAFVAANLAAAAAFDVRVVFIKLGVLRLFKRGRVTLGLLPLGTSVRFHDTREAPELADEEHAFDRKPRLVRATLALSGPVGITLLAFGLRGPAAWPSLRNAFGQIIDGTFAPATRGADLVAGYLAFAHEAGFIAALGSFAAKCAVGNLLPVPMLAGGMALLELMRPNDTGPRYENFCLRLSQAGLLVFLAMLGSWLYAGYVALTR